MTALALFRYSRDLAFSARDGVRIIIWLVVAGVCWWLLGYVPIAEPFKTLIRVVVILLVILWILNQFGML